MDENDRKWGLCRGLPLDTGEIRRWEKQKGLGGMGTTRCPAGK